MKRFVSILLVIVMVFSLASASALSLSYHRHNYTKPRAASSGTHRMYCYYPGCTKYITENCDFILLKYYTKKVSGKNVKIAVDKCTVCGRQIEYKSKSHLFSYCKH